MTDRIGYMDHISLAVPDVEKQVDFFTEVLGMTAHHRSPGFGMVSDPDSRFQIELTKADGPETKLLHIGLQVADVDGAFDTLVSAGLSTVHAPHRREFAKMRTAFVRDAAGLEVQVAKMDPR